MPSMTVAQFGSSIKQKYPEYKSKSDQEVGQAMLEKYPQYKDRVSDNSSFLSNIASGAGDVANKVGNFVAPALSGISREVGAGLGLRNTLDQTDQSIQQSQGMSAKLIQRAQQETDPAKKAMLLNAARQSSQVTGEVANDVLGSGEQAMGLKPGEEIQPYWKQGLKAGAEAGSLMMPAGGATWKERALSGVAGGLGGFAQSKDGSEAGQTALGAASGVVSSTLLGKIGGTIAQKGEQMAQGAAEKAALKVGQEGEEKVSETAARTMASLFPFRRNKATGGLDPVNTSRELLKLGVGFKSLDDLAEKSSVVTGREGNITQAVRDLVGKIPEEIQIDNASTAADNMLKGKLGFTKEARDEVTRSIADMVGSAPGEQLGKTDPFSAFEIERQLQEQGSLFNQAYQRTKEPKYRHLADAYRAAYEEISDEIDKKASKYNLPDSVKTPERISALSEISPKLAEEFQNAKTVSDLRRLQKPFVDAQIMSRASSDASNMILSREAQRTTAAGVGALLGSFMGPFGAMGGSVAGRIAEPTISNVTQKVEIPATVKAAQLINSISNADLGNKVGNAVGSAASSTLSKSGNSLRSGVVQKLARIAATRAGGKAQ